jgi:hypothetical protein
MLTCTWPYGTRKRVRIIEVVERGRTRGIVCEHLGESRAATVLLTSTDAVAPRVGLETFIEFREGGPTGGHWALTEEPAESGVA